MFNLNHAQSLLMDADSLLEFAKDTRMDFHETDEQNIRLVGMVGTNLDNACGNNINTDFLANGYQEAVILVQRSFNDKDGIEQIPTPYAFNLATLFAFAKIGAKAVVEHFEKNPLKVPQ